MASRADPFKRVEICERAKVEGAIEKRSLTALVIPSEGRVELKPGQQ